MTYDEFLYLDTVRDQAESIGRLCIRLYRWSPSECQWAQRHESVNGLWEWYFW